MLYGLLQLAFRESGYRECVRQFEVLLSPYSIILFVLLARDVVAFRKLFAALLFLQLRKGLDEGLLLIDKLNAALLVCQVLYVAYEFLLFGSKAVH